MAPDVGLSAPYNSWFTLFGQFFDHGLDLVTKGGNGSVFMPLQADDPLFVTGSPTNFMVLPRATMFNGHEARNTTTPFVDQNQTYTSHPSHQVFLRDYELVAGDPVTTGRLIDGAIAGNIGNWAEVKTQAATLLGIQLEDIDVLNVPLLATDPYGHFIPGPNGFPQVVFPRQMPASRPTEGDPAAPISVVGSLKTEHAFLDDIAHNAAPSATKTPDGDTDVSTAAQVQPAGTYDDELLDLHFVTGDGRGNENIGLTAVHTVFHAEHNRLVDDIDTIIQTPAQRGRDHRLADGHRGRVADRLRLDLQRAAVPGRPVRDRDGVPAPGVRGVRPPRAAADQPLRRLPDGDQPGDRGRVRTHRLPLRPLHAHPDRRPHGHAVPRPPPARRTSTCSTRS